jgi:hypothetical protein
LVLVDFGIFELDIEFCCSLRILGLIMMWVLELMVNVVVQEDEGQQQGNWPVVWWNSALGWYRH